MTGLERLHTRLSIGGGVYGEYSNPASYNPDYAVFSGVGGDCQNFVSQALYEGGKASMFISPWSTNLGQGDNGWFYLTPLQYAAGWSDVNHFFSAPLSTLMTQHTIPMTNPPGRKLGETNITKVQWALI